jgi:hypothetical protein
MSILYSPSKEGFYNTDVLVYPVLPNDCVELTSAEHAAFLREMNNSNKRLVLKDDELVLEDREEIITWEMIRSTRNNLLSSSDYTQVPDFPGDQEAWAKYRQELREITDKFTSPDQVEWPNTPNN